MLWAFLGGGLVLALLGAALRSAGGQDWLARRVGVLLEVGRVVGADPRSGVCRGMFVYRAGEQVVLGASQEAVAAALVGEGEGGEIACLLEVRRVVALGAGRWGVVLLPPRWAWLGQAGCEHGGRHEGAPPENALEEAMAAVLAGAPRARLYEALEGATVFIAGFSIAEGRVRLSAVTRGGQEVIAAFSSARRAAVLPPALVAGEVAFGVFLELYQPGLPLRINGDDPLTLELSVLDLMALKTARADAGAVSLGATDAAAQ